MLGLAKVFTTTSPKNPVQPRTVRIFPVWNFRPVWRRPDARLPEPRSASCCCDLSVPWSHEAELNWLNLLGDAVGKEIQEPGTPSVLSFWATLPLKPTTITLKIGHLAFQEQKNTNQVIQSDPTWSPIVGGHDFAFERVTFSPSQKGHGLNHQETVGVFDVFGASIPPPKQDKIKVL